MTPDERARLRQDYGFSCGYCGVREADVGAELTVDHFHPTSHGGLDAPANWVYCCFACNCAKSDHWAPHSTRRVLHPLRDDLSKHIAPQEDGTLLGLTETGRFHLEVLRLNRPSLVRHRLEKQRRSREESRRSEMLTSLAAIQREIAALQQRLRDRL